ncbi:VanZ family protein [Tepidibacillus marianensis]|uniref:VanZ family protein n=1 Tax=Tepidibacillus marianensis TaxID=3131995 RepID=UPI0030D5F50F
MVAYFGLSLTFMWALTDRISTKKAMVLAVLFSVLYGMTDEWHQAYVPGRTPDIHDLVNDFIGATVGAFVFFYWMRKRRKTE